ncbi:hypothetical protein [Pedobacter sp.]
MHTDKIKTFEDACKVLGISETVGQNLNSTTDEIAYKKLKVIVKALNGDWKADWNNYDQRKYYPYFDMSVSGFSSHYYSYYDRDSSSVSSRLCFKSRELAEYAGKQFVDLYKAFMLETE